MTLLIALLVLAGCGGGDGGPSHGEFTADANRICREGEQAVTDTVERAQQEGMPDDPEERAATLLETATRAYEPILVDLRELEAPEDLRADWDTFLDRVNEAYDLFPQLADATRAGDREQLGELARRFQEIAEETRPFAQDNDLGDCLPEV